LQNSIFVQPETENSGSKKGELRDAEVLFVGASKKFDKLRV